MSKAEWERSKAIDVLETTSAICRLEKVLAEKRELLAQMQDAVEELEHDLEDLKSDLEEIEARTHEDAVSDLAFDQRKDVKL